MRLASFFTVTCQYEKNLLTLWFINLIFDYDNLQIPFYSCCSGNICSMLLMQNFTTMTSMYGDRLMWTESSLWSRNFRLKAGLVALAFFFDKFRRKHTKLLAETLCKVGWCTKSCKICDLVDPVFVVS